MIVPSSLDCFEAQSQALIKTLNKLQLLTFEISIDVHLQVALFF